MRNDATGSNNPTSAPSGDPASAWFGTFQARLVDSAGSQGFRGVIDPVVSGLLILGGVGWVVWAAASYGLGAAVFFAFGAILLAIPVGIALNLALVGLVYLWYFGMVIASRMTNWPVPHRPRSDFLRGNRGHQRNFCGRSGIRGGGMGW